MFSNVARSQVAGGTRGNVSNFFPPFFLRLVWSRHRNFSQTFAKGRAAVTLSASDEDLRTASGKLRAGGLVAFPNETVYGLGANAWNEDAIRRVFEVKGRPLSSPLIVHVPSPESAHDLLDLSSVSMPVYNFLARTFWPGPLTLIGQAHESLLLSVSAGTVMVGIRCPDSPIARRFLELANVPVAAPSANRFGHVSPTSADHVLEDLGDHDLYIVNGGSLPQHGARDAGRAEDRECRVGIESTVAKIDGDNEEIVLLRLGGVGKAQIEDALRGSPFFNYSVVVRQKGEDKGSSADSFGDESPGQTLKHYAPDVPASLARFENSHAADSSHDPVDWEKSVVLDFGGALKALEPECLAYMDLSPSGDMDEAANKLFGALRWSESVPGAGHVLVSDISDEDNDHALRDAVKDRLFRSACGRSVVINAFKSKAQLS